MGQFYKNNKPFTYEGFELKNITDVYTIRKRLCTLKDIERADFNTLLGCTNAEFNFSKEKQLDFHSNFDSGNLNRVVLGEDGVYYLESNTDTNSTGHSLWYHFAVSQGEKGATVRFRLLRVKGKDVKLKYIFCKSKKEERKKEIGWIPHPCLTSKYQDLKSKMDQRSHQLEHGTHVIEFTYTFKHDKDVVTFALGPVYNYEDLQFDSFCWANRSARIESYSKL